MTRAAILLAALSLSGCVAAPVWVTAASVTALAGTATAALTFDTELLKVYDDQHPPTEKTP